MTERIYERDEAHQIADAVEEVTGKPIRDALDDRVGVIKAECKAGPELCGAFVSSSFSEEDTEIPLTGYAGHADPLPGKRTIWNLNYGCNRGGQCGCSMSRVNTVIGGLIDSSLEAVAAAEKTVQEIKGDAATSVESEQQTIDRARAEAQEEAERRKQEIYRRANEVDA